MSSDDVIPFKGVVTGINRGGIFNVDITVGDPPEVKSVLAKCSGRMNKFSIKLAVGDAVDLEFSPYDLTRGRIVRRNK